MPELPEVETVRRGLAAEVVGRTFARVRVLAPRMVRQHQAGVADFESVLVGRTVTGVLRRGKYLWFALDDRDAMIGHLGMSGQMLLRPAGTSDETHLRVRFSFVGDGPELRFVDQRMFGGLRYSAYGAGLPTELERIALDPLDTAFDAEELTTRLLRRKAGIKRLLLDQSVISGIGNIYADEVLWKAKIHGERSVSELSRRQVLTLLQCVKEVFTVSIAAGGTTFDGLYVNVNGESGRFSHSLQVYGRSGVPCLRCDTPITRQQFMGRSSYFCPRCQPAPINDQNALCDEPVEFPNSS